MVLNGQQPLDPQRCKRCHTSHAVSKDENSVHVPQLLSGFEIVCFSREAHLGKDHTCSHDRSHCGIANASTVTQGVIAGTKKGPAGDVVLRKIPLRKIKIPLPERA